MKKITILIAVFISVIQLNSQAQSWEWATTSASDGSFYTCSDAQGNVYQAGKFSGTASFSGTQLTSGPGYTNWFIAKYNSNGVLQWVKKALAGTTDREIIAMTADNASNIFIAGYFSETIEVAGTSITSVGDRDAFLAKFNTSGTLQWIKTGGGTYDEAINDLVCDDAGNIYATGFFTESATFGGQQLTSQSVNMSSDGMLLCYSSDGNISYAKSFGGLSSEAGHGIAIYDNHIYLSGHFRSNDFVFQTETLHWAGSGGDYDFFVAALNLNGQLQWLKGFTSGTGGILFRKESKLAANSTGLYFTGQFTETIDLGNGILNSQFNGANAFLAKFDFNGNTVWANALTGRQYVSVRDIIATPNHVYLAGNYTDTLKFLGQNYIGRFGNFAVAENNGFVISINSDGTLEWIKNVFPYQDGSLVGTLLIDGLAAYNNSVYVSSSFSNTISLGSLSPATDGVIGNIDALVAKIDVLANIDEHLKDLQVSVYPNPATEKIYVQTAVRDNYSISLLNTNGQIVMSDFRGAVSDFSLDISSLSKGIYFLEVRSEKNLSKSKLIIY